jgi:hypothetical protein
MDGHEIHGTPCRERAEKLLAHIERAIAETRA